MVQDDKGKDKKIILFTSDITVTIKFNGNFKNNHLQAIIEKIWFEGDFIWLDITKLKFLMEECMKKKIRILFWYGLIGVA